MVKNSPAMQEMWVRSLGQEDSLEKEMATYSSILAWEIPWTEEPGGLQSVRLDNKNIHSCIQMYSEVMAFNLSVQFYLYYSFISN